MKPTNESRRQFLIDLPGYAVSMAILASCSDDEESAPPPAGPTTPTVTNGRESVLNPYVTGDGRPVLISVAGNDINAMLTAGLAELGGLAELVDDNQSVFIKPNCNFSDPYPAVSSADCISALITAVGAVSTGSILVGDQGYQDRSVVYPHMGLDTLVPSLGATLVNFTDGNIQPVRCEDWADDIEDYRVYAEAYDSPIILNACTIKRHRWASMSCSLKNNVGVFPSPDATGSREELHALSGNSFKRRIADMASFVKPELNIVDARSVLTVDGPFADWGTIVPADRLVICGDMVATDAYCAQLLAAHDAGFDPAAVQVTLDRAAALGLGTSDLAQVAITEISV